MCFCETSASRSCVFSFLYSFFFLQLLLEFHLFLSSDKLMSTLDTHTHTFPWIPVLLWQTLPLVWPQDRSLFLSLFCSQFSWSAATVDHPSLLSSGSSASVTSFVKHWSSAVLSLTPPPSLSAPSTPVPLAFSSLSLYCVQILLKQSFLSLLLRPTLPYTHFLLPSPASPPPHTHTNTRKHTHRASYTRDKAESKQNNLLKELLIITFSNRNYFCLIVF